MTILVNGEAEELRVIGKNGIECTNDILGNYGSLHYDQEMEAYTMTNEKFEWWAPVVDALNEINELEEKLSEDARKEYEAEDFSCADLDDEVKARLEWLKSHE